MHKKKQRKAQRTPLGATTGRIAGASAESYPSIAGNASTFSDYQRKKKYTEEEVDLRIADIHQSYTANPNLQQQLEDAKAHEEAKLVDLNYLRGRVVDAEISARQARIIRVDLAMKLQNEARITASL